MRFEIKNDCVLDTASGLHWSTELGNSLTWSEAKDEFLSDLNNRRAGGYDDWRLPSRRELRTIVDYGVTSPAIDSAIFKNVSIGNYWCDEEYPMMNKRCAWVIFMGLGSSVVMNKSNKENVIAVRGPKLAVEFIDNGNGIISDKTNGLMWQKGENPRMNLSDAQAFCSTLTLGGYTDWRLPTLKELGSLLDMSYSDGWWYYKDFFPADGLNPPLLHYFSATEFENYYEWVINFCFGYDGYYGGKGAQLLFRAVRGEKDATESSTADPAENRRHILNKLTPSAEKTTELGTLTWERKQNFDNGELYTYDEAKAYIDGLNSQAFGGFSDWRLPHREELRTLYNEFWTDTLPEFYWCCEDGPESSLAWGIYFAYGCAICYPKTNKYNVRAVRGAYTPPKFKPMDNGCVLDETSGLIWKQDESPDMNIAEAKEYCKKMDLGGFTDWRMPTMTELAALIDLNGSRGAWFDKTVFPNVKTLPQGFYMSSTPFADTFLWGVNFQFAYDGYYADPNSRYPFRPVCGGKNEI